MKKHSVWALVLILALGLGSSGMVAAAGDPTMTFVVGSAIEQGQETTVEVWLNGVSDFYAAEFKFSFDDTIVTGLDIQPGAAWTAYPNEHQILQSSIVSGTVHFAATLLRVAKAPPLNGNLHLATITFRAIAEEGTSPLNWTEIKLADSYGAAIDHVSENGEIVVEMPKGAASGRAMREGRDEHSGIDVTLTNSTVMTTTTGASGWYTFTDVPSDTYDITIASNLYLTVVLDDCPVRANETAWMPDVTLLGGDLNGDQVIDISDLVIGGASFGTADPAADINADGTVDIFDIVLIGKNFGLTAPIMQVCVP